MPICWFRIARVASVFHALLVIPGALQGQVGGRDTTRAATLAPLTVSAERPRSQPPPVSTIDVPATKLRASGAMDAYDLVRRTAGVEVHDQGQGPGYASDVVLRGFSSDHSSDVLLIIDGVPINLPVHGHVEGYADWSVLTPAAVSAFRVITGTASPLYGDFALGGVVEVSTAADASGVSGALSGSNHGDASAWFRSGHRAANAGMLLAADARHQHGWRDNSHALVGNLLLRGWHRLGTGRIEGGLAGYGSTWDSPGFVSVSRYNAGDLKPALDSTDGGSAERLIAHGRITTRLGGFGLDASTWVQRVRSTLFLTLPEDDVLIQHDEEDERWAFGGRLQLTRALSAGDISLGMDVRADDAGYDLFRALERQRTSATKQFDGRYAGGGAFIRWRRLVDSRLMLDLGGRADFTHYRTRNRLTNGDWASGSETLLGPKLGARWFVGSDVSLLASLSRGFRSAPGVIEDPSLRPISAWSRELGFRYRDETARFHFALAGFRLDVRHERIQDPVTREISSAGESVRQGLSAEIGMHLTPALHVMADGTLNDAQISGDAPGGSATAALDGRSWAGNPLTAISRLHLEPLQPGDPVPNVARYVGRLEAELALSPALVTHAAIRFTGAYTPIGERTVRTQPYQVLDVGATTALPAWGAHLDIHLENVFNARTPEIRASGYINPGAPRMLRVALRFADRP